MRAPGEKLLEQKLTHSEVDYQQVSPTEHQRCGNCSMFIDASMYRCTDVRSPIYFGGWCNIWAPRPRKDEEEGEE